MYNVQFLTAKDVSLLLQGNFYDMSTELMLHRSETWCSKRESELSLHQAEMRMIRRMCGAKLRNTLQGGPK